MPYLECVVSLLLSKNQLLYLIDECVDTGKGTLYNQRRFSAGGNWRGGTRMHLHACKIACKQGAERVC